MKKSYITLLLLFMVMILGISAVSAADIDDSSVSDLLSADEYSLNEVLSEVAVDNAVAATDDAEVLSAGDGNFTELQNSINSNDAVLLDKDYTRVDGENDISISKDVTITGNNHKIDANSLGGIFKVNSGYTLTLIGVTLINGNAENGGAIYNDGGTLNIDNSYLLNNTAAKSGGAIYNNGGSVSVSGSTFDGNDLTERTKNGWGGAAIYDNAGTVSITQSTISNNLKDIVHRGGTDTYTGDLSSAAVTSTGTLTVSNSKFENNSGCYGGAILSNGANAVLTVSGSTFTNNLAFNGGAIDFTGNKYTITDSTFKGNKARGTGSSNSNYAHGGAIAATETNDDCVISNCKFEDNSAVMGGAISSTKNQIIGCNFTNNDAKAEYSENFNGKVNNRGGFGSAIYNDDSMTITDSNFIDNPNERNNGAVYARDAEITGSSFTNSVINVNRGPLTVSNNQYDNDGVDILGGNSPKVYFDGVGDVPNVKSVTLYSAASSFADLKALIDSGSATVFLTSDVTKLASEEETFADGILIDRSITINADGHTITANDGKVFTVAEAGALTLRNANVVGDGTSAIVNNGKVTVSLPYPNTFSNVGDFAIENNGRVTETSLTTFTQLNDLICLVSGGEVYIGSSKITKADDEKETFKDGIVIENDVTIIGTTTSKGVINTVIDADNDGRIFSVNDGADVTLDTLILKNGNAEHGGAVYVYRAGLTVGNVTFEDNVAAETGGAITAIESELTVADSKFINNTAVEGGAIGAYLESMAIEGSTFVNNTAKSGGAIYAQDIETEITGTDFINNTAESNAGAIYITGSNNAVDVIIGDVDFINNVAAQRGGAILIKTIGSVDISDSKFENNIASSNAGGAIYAQSPFAISGTDFISNVADGNGGAIYLATTDSSITESSFTGNSAGNRGGAVFLSSGTVLTIDKSKFINDESINEGQEIRIQSGASLTLTNSNITNGAGANVIDNNRGTLSLEGNTISGIIQNKGTITSEVVSTALDNKTIDTNRESYTFYATLVDDNGNMIYDPELRMVINDHVSNLISYDNGVYSVGYRYGSLIATVDTTSTNTYSNLVNKIGILRNIKGTFTDLQNLINNAGDSLVLPYNFTYNAKMDDEALKSGVVIDKAITIDGNGYTVDANNSARAFNVVADAAIENVKLVNGAAELGAAVYVDHAALTVDNVTFEDNVAVGAGAIASILGKLAISDSKFINNTANQGGAIAVFVGSLTVDGSTFENNTADYGGGAVYVQDSETKITDSDFINNTADNAGAIFITDIFNSHDYTINGANFINNTAKRGGAILTNVTSAVVISGSKFENNNASSKAGGAIYAQSPLAISVTDFISNFADGNGGAIYLASEGSTITGSTFTGNTAGNRAGAVYLTSGSLTIDESKFINDVTLKSSPEIRVQEGASLTLTNSNITNDAGAYVIYNSGGTLTLDGNTILGIIYNKGTITSEVVSTALDNKTTYTNLESYTFYATLVDDNGNMIYDPELRMVINDHVSNLIGYHEGLYEVGYRYGSTMATVGTTSPYTYDNFVNKTGILRNIKGTFTDLQNLIDDAGTDLILPYDFTYNAEIDGEALKSGVLIDQAISIDGNGYTINGSNAARIFDVAADATIENVKLVNGGADFGAAINAEDVSLAVNNVTFENNAVSKAGGAITAIECELTVKDSKFINNTAIEGGAIEAFLGSMTIEGSAFVNNTAKSGGAIYAQDIETEITGTDFINNTAKTNAGAIFIQESYATFDVTIDDVDFINNTAQRGGAILANSTGTVVISGSKFENNNASSKAGGAIYSESPLAISVTDFISNFADGNGGAIYLASEGSTITGSKFTGNTAGNRAGAVYLTSGSLTIDESEFINDLTLKSSPEIRVQEGASLTLTNSNITNDAGAYVIYNSNGTLTLDGNTILGIIYNKGTITSEVVSTALDNKTIETNLESYVFYATLVDDNGNMIYDPELKIVMNDHVSSLIGYHEGLYEVGYRYGSRLVTVGTTSTNKYDNFVNKTGILRNVKGTFTDLQNLINNAGDKLVLPYNFTYNAEIDGEALKAGVVIDKFMTVDGNGYTIDGAKVARIYQLNADDINIINTTFINGYSNDSSKKSADWGGAIYSNGANMGQVISDCKFYNNTAYNGGAIYLAGDNCIITDCEFEDNEANASGGAVFVFGWYSKIVDSTFKVNGAHELGAAVACYSSKPAEIMNCDFVGNVAGQAGGAVSMQRAAGKIINSNFTVNVAPNGAAVYWGVDGGNISGGEFTGNIAEGFGGAIFAEGTGLTINSTFIKNIAENGGAVAVFKDASITGSNFTENTAENYGGAVFVNEGAKLDITKSAMRDNKATVGSSIYSIGTMASTIVNATILNNKTWNDTGLGDIYTLNATLTDDMGNNIYDPSFRFTVDGVVIDDAPAYDDETGLYTVGYAIETAGLKVISASYDAENLQIFTGALDVSKVNVTKFTVTVPDVLEGDNTTVFVTLTGIDETGLDAIVTVIVNNKEYAVPVENGNGNITIEDLAHGQYPVVAMFEDINYYPAINSTVFYVKGQSKLDIAEITTAEYGDVIEVTIKLSDSEGNPISGVVEIDDVSKVLVYEDGIGTFVIDNQPDVGNYTFQAVYEGNDDYFGDLTVFNVTVTPKVIDPKDVVVDIPSINVFGDEIPVTITSPVDGTYTVNINGTIANIEVVNGTGSANFTLDKAGIYNATVDIAEEGYSLETITTDEFEYFKAPEFNAVITGTYPNAEISITGPAGTYHVNIDGFDTIDIVREESGLPTVRKIEGIDAGNYTAYVGIDEQGEYYGALKEVNFTVNKADLTIDELKVVGDKVIDSSINITFKLDTDVNASNVHAMIDGFDIPVDDFTINETTGIYTVSLSFPVADGHLFTVEVNDPNYEEASAQASFKIEKVTPEITISDIAAKVGDTVNATVTIAGGDATGYVLFNGMAYKVENGTAIIPLTVTKAGMQSINVTYIGDDKYANGTGVKAFNADKASTEIKLNDSEITVVIGENVEVKFTISPNVSEGNVTLWIDDSECATQEVTQSADSIMIPSFFLPDNGNYTIKVQYVGTSNYEDSENDTLMLHVVKVDVSDKITIEPVTITYGENATVIVSGFPEDATGNVTITVNDKSYTGKVENGEAEIVIPNLAAGDYEDVAVEYSGDDFYNATDANCAIYVNKASSKVTIFVISDQPYPGDIEIEYLIENETVRNITINGPNGEEVLYVIGEDDKIVLTDLAAGEYYVTIENKENENFTGSEAIDSFKVYKADPTFTSNVTEDAKVGENVTITVKAPADATGNVTVVVDGEIFATDVPVVDGVAIINITDLDAGHHSYEVTYNGDDNYETASDMNSFDVAKAETTVTIDVDDNLGVMDGSKVNITVSNNVTGYLAIDNNGVITVVEITDGKYSFEIYNLQAGDYYIDATFLGNDNYLESTASKQFEIPKSAATPEVTGYTPEIKGGEQAVVNVTMDSNFATGLVRIYVDGEEVGFAELDADYANATIVVNDLANGTHTIGIKYVGNDNFNESDIVNVTVNVVKADSKVTINPITNVTVGNDVVIYYNIENSTNNIVVEFTNPNDEITVDYELFGDRIVVHNLAAGDYEVKVYNMENDFYNTDAAVELFSVNKVDVSDKISIEPVTITYGENATVIVSGFPEAAGGNVTITVGNKSYTAKVENGAAEVAIPDLAAGDYEDVAVEYSGDDVYNATNANCAIYVNKASSKVTIFVISDQPYPGDIEIEYLIENKTERTITINGPKGEEVPYVIGADDKIVLTDLPAGEYYVTIENKENENFTGSEAIDSFKVYKADPTFTSNVTEDAKVGDVVTITVKAPADAAGNVTIVVDGELVGNVPVVDGVATVDVSGLDAGHHSYEVTYNGDDNYETSSDMNSFDVAKAETTVDIKVDETNIGVMGSSTVNVTVSNNVSGYIAIDDNGKVSVVEIVNGTYSFEIYDLQAGDYYINVTFLGNDNYLKSNATKEFNIPKSAATPAVAVVTPLIKGGEQAVIDVTMDNNLATGLVIIYVDGEEAGFSLLDENYANATIGVNDLGSGVHTIGVKYMGNDNFEASNIVNATVVVVKAGSEVTIEPIANVTYGSQVIVHYTIDNRTLDVKVSICYNDGGLQPPVDGIDYIVDDEKITINGLEAGNYIILIFNNEDELYTSSSDYGLFTVAPVKEEANITVKVPSDVKVGDNATVDVSIPGATGNVSVIVDGVETVVALDENGTASVPVNNVDVGEHDVVVIYPGDEAHTPTHAASVFTVPEPEAPEANITVPGDAKVGDNATVDVSIPGATGNVTVIVDGKATTVPLDENGKASVPVNDVTAGDHSVVVVYSGDETHSPTFEVSNFTVSDYIATEFANITIMEDLNITAVLVDANGNPIANAVIAYSVGDVSDSTVTGDDGSFTIKGANGVLVAMDYAGNSTYLATNTSIKFDNVIPERLATQFNVTNGFRMQVYAVDYKAGERGEYFDVLLTDSNGKRLANQSVVFAINGWVHNKTTDENGVAHLQINLQDANYYTCAPCYLGNVTYNATFASAMIDVIKKPITISAAAKSYKATAKTKKYTVTLKTIKGSSADGKTYLKSGRLVKLTVNGKTYNARINAKGQATFSLKLTKKGKYQATVKFDGGKTYESVSKKVNITIK